MKAHNPITQLEQLILNADARRFLKETASWTFFISILGIIGIAFMLFGSVISFFIFDSFPQQSQLQIPFSMGIAMSIFYLVFALLYVFPVYYLLQFSSKMKKALVTKNDEVLATSLEMLKSHYKYIGVLLIIVISLNILSVIAVALGAFAI